MDRYLSYLLGMLTSIVMSLYTNNKISIICFMIFVGKIAKYPVDYGLVQFGLDIRKTNRISIWVQPDFGFMNFILIWFAQMFYTSEFFSNSIWFRFIFVQRARFSNCPSLISVLKLCVKNN